MSQIDKDLDHGRLDFQPKERREEVRAPAKQQSLPFVPGQHEQEQHGSEAAK